MYLPLDKLMQSSSDLTKPTPEESSTGASATSRSPDPVRRRSTIRQGER